MSNEEQKKQVKELSHWDFPDTVEVPNGWDITSIPDLTRANFIILIEEHNKLANLVNKLLEARDEGEYEIKSYNTPMPGERFIIMRNNIAVEDRDYDDYSEAKAALDDLKEAINE